MRICIIGAFEFETMSTGGQPVKTRELYYALCGRYGNDNIEYVDTYNWKHKAIKLFLEINKKVNHADVVIMLPAINGVAVFAPMLAFYKKLKHIKLYYDVVGGWLPELIESKPGLKKALAKLDDIWVETDDMKRKLEDQGLCRVRVLPNFKRLKAADISDLPQNTVPPFRLCTFSRIMREKGIEDAANAVMKVNKAFGRNICELDIYGQIHPGYEKGFKSLIESSSGQISYKGLVQPNESVGVLKDYYALLFPTFYEGEGMAGTLIDAIFSGLPAIVSDWRYNREIIKDGYTGYIHKAADVDDLSEKIQNAVNDPARWNKMRLNCLNEAERYMPDTVVALISEVIEKG